MKSSVHPGGSGIPQTAPQSDLRTGSGTLILIGAFVVALAPYAVSSLLMYPDEPQYLDAGVFMCQTNNWLMPTCANDGAPEDLKPIFTYWVIALSYKLFGMSLAAARLPYLLAGAFSVWLTYRLTLLLTVSTTQPGGSRIAAALACALLLCNPVFWLSAVRSIPDIWLCLFLLMSAHGFIALLTQEVATTRYALMAYVGVALAFLTKGVPALMFLVYVAIFVFCNRSQPGAWRRLVHVPSMLVGAAVAISWFAAVFVLHGAEDLQVLWADQVASRAQRDPRVIAYRFPAFCLAVVLMNVPLYWPMWRMGNRWREVLPSAGSQRVAYWFIGIWVVFNLFAMSCTADWYVRYLIPLFPLLAALLAGMVVKVDSDILTHCFRRLLSVTIVGLSVLIAAVIVVNVQMGMTGLDWAVTTGLLGGIAIAAVVGLRGSWLRAAQAVAVSCMLMMPIVFFGARDVVLPDIEAQLAQDLSHDQRFDAHAVAGFVGPKGPATRLRLAISPRVKLLQWEAVSAEQIQARTADGNMPRLLIMPEQAAALLPRSEYAVHASASLFGSPDERELLRAIGEGRLKECLREHRSGYAIAVRVNDNARTAVQRPGQKSPG